MSVGNTNQSIDVSDGSISTLRSELVRPLMTPATQHEGTEDSITHPAPPVPVVNPWPSSFAGNERFVAPDHLNVSPYLNFDQFTLRGAEPLPIPVSVGPSPHIPVQGGSEIYAHTARANKKDQLQNKDREHRHSQTARNKLSEAKRQLADKLRAHRPQEVRGLANQIFAIVDLVGELERSNARESNV